MKVGIDLLRMKLEDSDARIDEDLVVGLQAKPGEESFVVLWRRHRGRIYRLCRSFAGNRQDAEDLTAQVFTLAWQKADRYHGGDFSAWLSAIARNCCINHARSAWSRRVTASEEGLAARANQLHHQCSPGDRTFSTELEELVNQLPDDQRIAVKLFFIDGYSYDQIAGLMKCNVKRVKSLLQNAKRKLQLRWFEPATRKAKE